VVNDNVVSKKACVKVLHVILAMGELVIIIIIIYIYSAHIPFGICSYAHDNLIRRI
jgi:hypothetical protein